MLFEDTYLTIKEPSQGLYKDRGSKFSGFAFPINNEEEAKQRLIEVKKLHASATHHCYAYRLGADKLAFRANDDGEPNNSAGIPILGQIQSFDLSNILIGVVRYYGGTKLGVGGLVQAYKTAAKDAIENGEIIEMEVFEWVKIHFDYSAMPHVMNFVKQHQLPIKEQIFEKDCSIITNLPLNSKEFLKEEIKKISETTIEEMGIN